jgi:hypothetical protein
MLPAAVVMRDAAGADTAAVQVTRARQKMSTVVLAPGAAGASCAAARAAFVFAVYADGAAVVLRVLARMSPAALDAAAVETEPGAAHIGAAVTEQATYQGIPLSAPLHTTQDSAAPGSVRWPCPKPRASAPAPGSAQFAAAAARAQSPRATRLPSRSGSAARAALRAAVAPRRPARGTQGNLLGRWPGPREAGSAGTGARARTADSGARFPAWAAYSADRSSQ